VGRFNSIQMAARGVPALKAIVAIDATEDLYQDDVHYMDGIMHLDSWENEHGPRQLEARRARLQGRRRQLQEPLRHRAVDADVQEPPAGRAVLGPRSVRDRYGDIRVPAFLIGGWYDGYRDSVARMLEHVKNAPVKAIVGAWNTPGRASPIRSPAWNGGARPCAGSTSSEGRGHGHPRRAALRRLRARLASAGALPRIRAGRWRYEDGWPIAGIQERILYPQPNHTLAAGAPAARRTSSATSRRWASRPAAPSCGGVTSRTTSAGRTHSASTYDSEPLAENLEILGFRTRS
jgi:predicted acyl esterase